MGNLVGLLGFLLLLGGIISLQVFLSRAQSRVPGLILPGICFLFSIIGGLGVAQFGGKMETLWTCLMTFLLLNISTVVLLGIYYACREKYRVLKQVEKMNIRDLE